MQDNIFCLLLVFLSKEILFCNANQGCFNSASPQLIRSEVFGNRTQPAWDDDTANQSPPVVAVRSIRIAGTFHGVILSIQVTYEREDGTLYVTPRRGDFATVYQVTDITLAQSECIVQVQGVISAYSSGAVRPVQLIFETRLANGTTVTYGPFGIGTGVPFSVEGNILGFYGRATTAIGGIGFDYQSLDFSTDPEVMTTNLFNQVDNITPPFIPRMCYGYDDHRYLVASTTGIVASLVLCAILFVAVIVILILCLKVRRLKKSTVSVTASQVAKGFIQTKDTTIKSEVDLTCTQIKDVKTTSNEAYGSLSSLFETNKNEAYNITHYGPDDDEYI